MPLSSVLISRAGSKSLTSKANSTPASSKTKQPRTISWSPQRLTPPYSARTHERGVYEIVRTRRRPPPHDSLKHSLGAGPRTTCRLVPYVTVPVLPLNVAKPLDVPQNTTRAPVVLLRPRVTLRFCFSSPLQPLELPP